MEKIFENFTVKILKLNKLIQKIKNFEIQEYGLKTIHVMCVHYLSERANGLTAAELVKLTLEDKAAISRALKTLHEKGYISYDLNKYNAVIKLTDEGRGLAEYVSSAADRAVKACSYDFTEEERRHFYSALGTIADKLENYYDMLIKVKKED